MSDQQKSWNAFRDQAMAVVNNGKVRKRSREYRTERVLQIVRESSFDTIGAVQLYRVDTGLGSSGSYHCIKTIWHQMVDQRQFMGPLELIKAMRLEQLGLLQPTIEYGDVDVDANFGLNVENRLRAIRLPLPGPSSNIVTGGGVMWTVRAGTYSCGASYHWSHICPDDWRPLCEIVEEVWSICRMADGVME